jgi:hypothetical protein
MTTKKMNPDEDYGFYAITNLELHSPSGQVDMELA